MTADEATALHSRSIVSKIKSNQWLVKFIAETADCLNTIDESIEVTKFGWQNIELALDHGACVVQEWKTD